MNLTTNPNRIEYDKRNKKVSSNHIGANKVFLIKSAWSHTKNLLIMKELSSFIIFPIFSKNFIILDKVHSRPYTASIKSKITTWIMQGVIKSIFLYIE